MQQLGGPRAQLSEQRRAEKERRAALQERAAIIDAMADGLILFNMDGTVVDVNPVYERMTGLKRDEVIGKPGLEIAARTLAPGELDKIAQAFRLATDGKPIPSIRTTLVRSDGHEWPIYFTTSFLPGPAGEPTGVIAVIKDITELRDAEQAMRKAYDEMETRVRARTGELVEANRALRESEEKYRSLVEHTPDIVIVTDADGEILFINRAVPGFTVDEAVGRKLFDYIQPEYHDAVHDCVARVLRTGQPDQYEIVGRGPHGVDAYYSTRVAPLRQGGEIAGLTMIARDVTEQKRAEHALRRSEEEYRALVEGAGHVIARIDRDGVFLFMNEVAARPFGGNVNDLIGKTMWDLFPKEVADHQMADVTHVFETGQPLSRQRKSILQGQECWFESTLQPLRGDDARVHSVLLISSDITERIEAHEKLEQLSQNIIHSQEELLTHVSRELHDELGQLIMGIDLELETMRKQLAAGKDTYGDCIRRAREIVRAATEALRDLCSNLRSPNVDEVGLTSAIESHIRDLRHRTDIDIRYAFSLGNHPIDSNMALALFRIAQEALTNVVRHAEAKRVEVRLREESGHVILEISDDGRGFDPDPKQLGAGHGLRSMRERSELLGGRLDIKSKPGQGTRIRVSAPRMPGE